MSNDEDKRLIEKRDELIFDLIKRRFDGEIDRANKLDGKANNMVGFVSVVIGLTLGGGSALTGGNLFKDLSLLTNQNSTILYFVGITVLLISIGCALIALKVRKWTVVPNVNTLIEKYTKLDYSEVLKRNAGEMRHSITSSEKKNKNKAKFIDLSWYALLLGLVLIFVSYVFQE